jgi:hypothetical protein
MVTVSAKETPRSRAAARKLNVDLSIPMARRAALSESSGLPQAC